MKLYGYFRSSASYRLRIALNLKGLTVDTESVGLLDAAQLAAYRAVNPQGFVPALDTGEALIPQSIAILEYLEELHPEPALLPPDPAGRAFVRSVAQFVACEIHPLNNLRVLKHLREIGQDKNAVDAWYRHWIADGFARLEAWLAASGRSGPFVAGAAPGIAECCIVPQIFNARRYACDLTPYPALVAIDAHCATLEAFQRAHPDRQPDATP